MPSAVWCLIYESFLVSFLKAESIELKNSLSISSEAPAKRFGCERTFPSWERTFSTPCTLVELSLFASSQAEYGVATESADASSQTVSWINVARPFEFSDPLFSN